MRWKNNKKVFLPSQNGKILVGGCFDIIHFGHIQFLQKSKEFGSYLIVAIESDEFIEKRKKRKPIHTQEQRAQLVAAIEVVDYVLLLPIMNTHKDYMNLVESIRPSVIAVTKGDVQMENKKKQANEVGAEVKVALPRINKFATSNIVSYATISRD